MQTTPISRRQLMAGAAAVATTVALPRLLAAQSMPSAENDVLPVEDLMREHGVLRPASWDEAMTRAAAGFAAARAKGPQAFGLFSCSKATNEMVAFADGCLKGNCKA